MRRILILCVSLLLLISLTFPVYGFDDENWLLNSITDNLALTEEDQTFDEESLPEEEQVPVAEPASAEEPISTEGVSQEGYRPVGSLVDPITQWTLYDALIKTAKYETDTANRKELMYMAEDILMATYCVIPLYYYNDVYLEKDYVKGIYANSNAVKYFMYAELLNGAETLNINLSGEPDCFDPALMYTVDVSCFTANTFSGLYTYNSEGVTVPACAEGYTVSEDGCTYTVTLKSGLKWSDGTPLTAADFEYSWKRAADPATYADYSYLFETFDGYEEGNLNVMAVDDTTLVFVLKTPCVYMEDLMSFPTFYPVQKAYVEAHSTADDPGAWARDAGFPSNGAFVCSEWNHYDSITLKKNPYWYDADNVSVNYLWFKLSDDMYEVFDLYTSGNIDIADTVPADEAAGMIANGSQDFRSYNELGTYYVVFNAGSKLFEGKTTEQAAAMRQAFSMLIDRKYIVEEIGRFGQMGANTLVPIGMLDGNGGVFHRNSYEGYYDPFAISNDFEGTVDKAIDLMKFAGFKFDETGLLSADTPIKIKYLVNDGAGNIAIAEAMRSDLAVVGIDMEIITEQWSEFYQDRRDGNFDVAREGWIADYNDPINMLELFTTDSPNNDCQFGRAGK